MENLEKPEKSEIAETEEAPEFKGKNLEDAILHAEHKLKLPRTEFEYEVVTEKTRLFGLGKEVVIRAKVKIFGKSGDLTAFLDRLMNVFPLELTFEVKTKDDIDFVIFGGADKQILLWKDGALLLAIQHLLNKISERKVQVDCEFFRKRKEKSLHDYTLDVARRVSDSGHNEILDLMNPYERRIVHIAANQVPGITSESLGEGFLKRVKIFPLNKHPR